jgi:tRNA(Ile)-lysidine synthetase-like protein
MRTLLDFPDWSAIEGGHLVLSCSGGIDSVVLAHASITCVAILAEEHFWKKSDPSITLWHLRHGIRTDDGDDAHFVRELGKQLNVSVVVESVNVPDSRRPGIDSIESVARRLRYERLCLYVRGMKNCFAFTAHHADDNAETILFNLLRGTGPAGLRGINPRTRDNICRPLLSVRSSDIAEYAQEHSLPWREDPSNQDQAHTRNYIRHEIMPRLLQVNNRSVDHINRLAGYATDLLERNGYDDYSFVSKEEICHRLPLLATPFADFGHFVFHNKHLKNTQCIGGVLRRINVRPSYELVSDLHWSLTKTNESVHHGNWHFSFPVPGSGIMFYECVDAAAALPEQSIEQTDVKDISLDDAARLEIVSLAAETTMHIESRHDPRINNWSDWLILNDFNDIEEIGDWFAVLPKGMYRFRTRRDADRISLPNGVRRKIGDVFTDRQIPLYLRDCWAILVNEQDEPVWIPGICDSQRMHELQADENYCLASIRPLE